jgi:hypothetical protein
MVGSAMVAGPVQTTAPTHASRAEVSEIVAAMGGELDEIAHTLASVIHEHLADELDDDLFVLTRESTRSNLGLIVELLREGLPPTNAVAPPEALGYAREYVRRGLGLALLMRAYRTAQAAFSRMWLERLRARTTDPDQLADAMGFFNDWLFAWVEVIERRLTEAFLREREQWLRGAAAMRAAEVRALLEGARPDIAETSKRLGYALDRTHVAFIVWTDGDCDDEHSRFGALEQQAAEVGEALGASGLLVLPRGRDLVGWAGATQIVNLPAGPARIAFGTPQPGVDGFCRSHREAVEARRVAELCGRQASVAFADVALDALATRDLDAARAFVRRELGPLAGDDDTALRLRATLTAYFDAGSSFVRAARRLGIHENTVTYRVHRAEELLGHRVSERQLELRVALRLARLV